MQGKGMSQGGGRMERMKKQLYKNAPVSEVICGITWPEPVLYKSGQFFSVLHKLQNEFPQMQFLSPLGDDSFDERGRSGTLNPLHTGSGLYRFSKEGEPWLIQLQHNKFYLNWVRSDQTSVGHYPGFQEIFTKFQSLLKQIAGIGFADFPLKYAELAYQDRIFFLDYIEKLDDIQEILNFNIPAWLDIGESMGFASESYFRLPEIQGAASVNTSTSKNLEGKPILSVLNSISGLPQVMDAEKWFTEAHEIHLEFFNKLFKEPLLDKWR